MRKLALLLCLLPSLVFAQETKPAVVILATGGTIAGAAASETSIGYKPGALAVAVLIDAVPQLREVATVRGEQIASIASQDMTDEILITLATRINELLATPEVAGIVVTHGTDTLEETAYFLQLTVKSDKPVVLTASMRPSTSMSADGPLNLYNAVAVAAEPEARGRGVMVVVNDDIHSARDVVKMHTTDLETFNSREAGLLGTLLFGKSDFTRIPDRKHGAASEFSVAKETRLPRVDILYAHGGMSADLIDAAVANGAKGLVIAGVGDGNMNAASIEAVRRARAKGIAVVRSTRLAGGAVWRNVEVSDDEIGTVVSGDLNPAKSRILLRFALTRTNDPKKLQEYFETY
jgi:L-asparaginase